VTDIRSCFSLVNGVVYIFSMIDKMLPFRELLKPGTPFYWDEILDALFEESKAIICNEINHGCRSSILIAQSALPLTTLALVSRIQAAPKTLLMPQYEVIQLQRRMATYSSR
jgi:hypothetical protein